MTPETIKALRKSGLTDEEIYTLWDSMMKDWEEAMRNMMVDGTAHPDHNSGPPSHFGGEIGDKIPFEGLKGLNRKKSGFRPKQGSGYPRCFDPSHNPPMHLYIPPDQEYVHVCPSCGATVIIGGQEISF